MKTIIITLLVLVLGFTASAAKAEPISVMFSCEHHPYGVNDLLAAHFCNELLSAIRNDKGHYRLDPNSGFGIRISSEKPTEFWSDKSYVPDGVTIISVNYTHKVPGQKYEFLLSRDIFPVVLRSNEDTVSTFVGLTLIFLTFAVNTWNDEQTKGTK